MSLIRSYVTNPEFLRAAYLDFNLQLANALSSHVRFIIHQKELYEPTISPIIGSGLPQLEVDQTDKLRLSLEQYTAGHANADFHLSQDVFAEIFSNADASKEVILHTFSGRDADFVIHNVYSDDALDAAFDHISPALFIPEDLEFSNPDHIHVLLFSEDLHSDFTGLLSMTKAFNAKLHFIIQQPKKDSRTDSILEKIAKANQIQLKDFRFSARFVERIDDGILDAIQANDKSMHWIVFQHSFLIKDFNNKSLNVNMYDLLAEAKHPIVIV
ncbi:hypothetical protein [Portibacter marinus]|uniref:hypothetical protein n=1 Tax=Portibacter marinus TaxID=2898660 RepID=UPI001F431243|nr:hypothetical protein [Portibacter marinus]